MMSSAHPTSGSSVVGTQPLRVCSGHWWARIPHAEHGTGDDPSAHHIKARSRKNGTDHGKINQILTILDVWLKLWGLRQGCTLWLQASATYLCTLEQPEAFYKLTHILRWAFLPLRWRA